MDDITHVNLHVVIIIMELINFILKLNLNKALNCHGINLHVMNLMYSECADKHCYLLSRVTQ